MKNGIQENLLDRLERQLWPVLIAHVNAAGLAFIYDDELIPLLDHGEHAIARASRVEPAASGRGWTADMSPVGGPLQGPFALQGEALKAEREWLEMNL